MEVVRLRWSRAGTFYARKWTKGLLEGRVEANKEKRWWNGTPE